MKINFKVNSEKLLQSWQDTVELTNDFRPLFNVILGSYDDSRWWTLRGSVARNFASKSAPDGNTWAELALSTQRYKANRFPGAPMLVRTGKLFNSLVRGGDGAVSIMSQTSMQFGTTVEYAVYHQAGTKNIEKRPFLGLVPKQRQAINRLIKSYVVATMTGKSKPRGDAE